MRIKIEFETGRKKEERDLIPRVSKPKLSERFPRLFKFLWIFLRGAKRVIVDYALIWIACFVSYAIGGFVLSVATRHAGRDFLPNSVFLLTSILVGVVFFGILYAKERFCDVRAKKRELGDAKKRR